MPKPEQKKAPGGQANGADKGGTNNAPKVANSSKNASENHDDRPDYSDRHHGQDETPVDDSKSLLVDPLEERLQPFYGVDDCGHIADWDNEAALIGCAFLDPVLVMSALENVGLENPVDLFGDKRHRIIFKIARGISNRNGALDMVTFSAALKTEEQAGREKPGIVSYNYISALIEKVPSPGNYSYYLETVLDRYKARRKRQLMQRQYTLENANPNGAGDVNESIDDTIAELEKIRSVGLGVKSEECLIIDGHEFLKKTIEKKPVLIEGLLKQGSKMVLGGGSKSFKTWTLLNLGLSVAYGKPFWGHEVKQGRVLYVDLELDEEDLHYRKAWIIRAMEIRESIPGKFDILPLRGKLSQWRKQSKRQGVPVDPFEKIVDQVKASGIQYSLIILDPLYKFLGGRNENDAGDMADLFADIECLSDETGAAVVIGVHFSKGNQALKEAIDRISGSGVFARDPDSIVVMTPLDEKQGDFTFQVEARLRKFKPLKKFAVRWEEPLMVRDDTLDADDLKGKGGASEKGSVKELAELIPPGEGITKKELIKLGADKFNSSEKTARTKFNKAIENNAIHQKEDLFYRSN
jgi:hypothetical protein